MLEGPGQTRISGVGASPISTIFLPTMFYQLTLSPIPRLQWRRTQAITLSSVLKDLLARVT